MKINYFRVWSLASARRCSTSGKCRDPHNIVVPQSSQTEVSSADSQAPTQQQKLKAAITEEFARRQTKIDFKELKHESKIPQKPSTCPIEIRPIPNIDLKTLQLLERLSLVKLETNEAFKNLKDSIEFAEKVLEIDTKGVEPMYSVLENFPLRNRVDELTDGNIKDDILKNASVTEEDYFVAPPGNIPLEQKEKNFK